MRCENWDSPLGTVTHIGNRGVRFVTPDVANATHGNTHVASIALCT